MKDPESVKIIKETREVLQRVYEVERRLNAQREDREASKKSNTLLGWLTGQRISTAALSSDANNEEKKLTK